MIRVLIVEDEEDFAEPLAFLLRKEGFWPVVTSTGPSGSARRALRQTPSPGSAGWIIAATRAGR